MENNGLNCKVAIRYNDTILEGIATHVIDDEIVEVITDVGVFHVNQENVFILVKYEINNESET